MRGYGAPWAPDRASARRARKIMRSLTDPADRRLLGRFMEAEPLSEAEDDRIQYVILPLIREAARDVPSE